MQTTDHEKLALLLRERMEELLFEIVEIQDYLSKERNIDSQKQYPLGVMGRVLSKELQDETLGMLEQTEQVLCEKSAGSWEKNRASLYLISKTHALAFFMRILSQLPAGTQTARDNVNAMMQRASERRADIETTLAALAKQNVAISA